MHNKNQNEQETHTHTLPSLRYSCYLGPKMLQLMSLPFFPTPPALPLDTVTKGRANLLPTSLK